MFDAQKELTEIKVLNNKNRKKRYSKSKLDKYHDELLALRTSGATFTECKAWLQSRKVRVAWSTVQRWFANHG